MSEVADLQARLTRVRGDIESMTSQIANPRSPRHKEITEIERSARRSEEQWLIKELAARGVVTPAAVAPAAAAPAETPGLEFPEFTVPDTDRPVIDPFDDDEDTPTPKTAAPKTALKPSVLAGIGAGVVFVLGAGVWAFSGSNSTASLATNAPVPTQTSRPAATAATAPGAIASAAPTAAAGVVRVNGQSAVYAGACSGYTVTFVWTIEGAQSGNFLMHTATGSGPYGPDAGPFQLAPTGTLTWDPATGKLTLRGASSSGASQGYRAQIIKVNGKDVTGDGTSIAAPGYCG